MWVRNIKKKCLCLLLECTACSTRFHTRFHMWSLHVVPVWVSPGSLLWPVQVVSCHSPSDSRDSRDSNTDTDIWLYRCSRYFCTNFIFKVSVDLITVSEARKSPHLIVSTTTKGSALSSRNPIPSPHWLEAIDGWKEGAMQPIRKRDGRAESTKRQKWREARHIVFMESREICGIFVKPHLWMRLGILFTSVVSCCRSLWQGQTNCRKAVFKSCFSADMWPFCKWHKQLIRTVWHCTWISFFKLTFEIMTFRLCKVFLFRCRWI